MHVTNTEIQTTSRSAYRLCPHLLGVSSVHTDHDKHTLSYDLPRPAPGMIVDSTTGRILWTPTIEQLGTHPVTVRVQDGHGGYDFYYNQRYSHSAGINSYPLRQNNCYP